MTFTIEKVALAGATGNVGKPTLKALVETGRFKVTVLVRQGASHEFPPEVQVQEVDLNSFDDVKAALQGQDAFINTTSIQDPSVHLQLIDAAQAAGVYRVIPADFGMNPETTLGPAFPVFAVKDAALSHLKKLTKNPSTKLTWTVVSNGPFLDWNAAIGFLGIDLKQKKAQIMSGGEVRGPQTTLEAIGKATAAVLLHPEETANRNVRIQSVTKSQNELLALSKEALGPEGWEITQEDSQEKYDWAIAELQKGNYEDAVWMYQIRQSVADPRYNTPWEKNDNELLGVKSMTDDEVKDLIKKIVAENMYG